ncbi:hypothetical protein BBO99_00008298 [Phytophthora kernoviae]|uniref:Uncharacterized protein n=2 Tax=Phytophthora kernoviae TaxID=325452 RepID=A0A3R7HE40_9STRA|nr:hypothetical protein G195_008500 [Phytophthora kernoviae 00238/432]KAG2512425.1 hypothetical protein JM16_008061 [Phytophthora kernoviae]KAG2516538.1 hypothetical protein JM18_007999 [Phytophthora kernoviae]RLN45753.1 hypothetical protein BBI17_008247 [Phytophthora kernoviae]RLN75473.1 hypothetical protein BBO99_00008298 [Phytophthora kernoviae]
MDAPVHQINESSLMLGNATGDGQVLGLPLNWVETHRAVSLLIAFGCCVVASLLSVYNIVQHLAHYSRPQLQRYIVRILVIVPVYAMGSLLSLTFVNQALYFDSIRDCYEAFVVYSFLALVLSFAGGESVCVLKMQGEPDIRHPWPLNRCLDPVGRDGRLLRSCKRATLQFVFIKPIFAALSLLMLACGKYHTLAYQLILVVVYNISYSMALYGLWVFYLATKHILQPFNPVIKFFAVKSVVFLTFWQSSLLSFVPGITNEQSFAWKDFILCLEMVLFAVIHLAAFNSNQFKKNLDRLPDSEVLKNMKEVLSLSDIVADAYHNFMPSYRDYMLQRGGESTGRAGRRKNNASGSFGTDSSSDGSPTPMAHSNARAPRFVIDDEDDDEFEEIDLETGSTSVADKSPTSTTTEKALESKISAEKEGDADVTMANPQDDHDHEDVEAGKVPPEEAHSTAAADEPTLSPDAESVENELKFVYNSSFQVLDLETGLLIELI